MTALLGTRLVAALVILALLVVLYAAAPAAFPFLAIATFLIALAIQIVGVRYFVPKAVTNTDILSLRVRAQDTVAGLIGLAILAGLGGLMVARALDRIPPVDRGVFLVGIVYAFLMLASPVLNALLTWKPWAE